MANYELAVKLRSEVGTSSVRKLRRQDLIPAVIYGPEKDNVTISVDARDLHKALTSGASLIDLVADGVKRTVIVKDTQREPLKGDILHVDFLEVAMDRAIQTVAHISLTGEDERASDGGIVDVMMRDLEISCLPGNIPDAIVVDISQMTIGDIVHVGDLDVPEGVEILADPDEAVVRISEPAREEVEEAEEDEEGDVPEVGEEATEETADDEE